MFACVFSMPCCFFLFGLLNISSLFVALSIVFDGAERDMRSHKQLGEKGLDGVESVSSSFPEQQFQFLLVKQRSRS